MSHTCNPSTLGGLDGQTALAQEFETSLGNTAQPCLYKKYKKQLGMVKDRRRKKEGRKERKRGRQKKRKKEREREGGR